MQLHQVIPKNSILGDPVTVHGLGIIPLIGDTATRPSGNGSAGTGSRWRHIQGRRRDEDG